MDLEKREMNNGADSIMPLPLTDEALQVIGDEFDTTEIPVNEKGLIIPGFGRPNITVIPIVPGVTGRGYIRYFNANSSIGPVDIYVNGKLVAANLRYREFTEYMRSYAGSYRVAVFRAGTRTRPVSRTNIHISKSGIYTLAVIGTAQDPSLQLITDNKRAQSSNISTLRFAQLSPNAPIMDIYLDDRLILTDVDYREVSRYLNTNPGSHNLKLAVAVSRRTLLEEPDLRLQPGKAYTVYIVGNMNERPGLQVIPAMEGTSYLNM